MNQDSATAQTTREPLREQYRRLAKQVLEEGQTYFSITELHEQLAGELADRLAKMVLMSTLLAGDPRKAAITVSFTTLLIGLDLGYRFAVDDMSNLAHGLREKVSA